MGCSDKLRRVVAVLLIVTSPTMALSDDQHTCSTSEKLCTPPEPPGLDSQPVTGSDENPDGFEPTDGSRGQGEDRAQPQKDNASERRDNRGGRETGEEHRPDEPPRRNPGREDPNGTSQVPCGDESFPTTGCPDLTVDPRHLDRGAIETQVFDETDCNVVEGHVPPGERRLLRFTFTTPNVGRGDLIVGAPADHPEWFEFSDCHEHHHFEEYADYRLWTEEGYLEWRLARTQMSNATPEEVFEEHPELKEAFVAGHKQGFCVIDIRSYEPRVPTPHGINQPKVIPAKYRSCTNNQGITVGWADEYGWWLDGQWIDITEIEPGSYVLEAEVNPERLFKESDYDNNAGAIRVEIPEG